MEFFTGGGIVRLRSTHKKYLRWKEDGRIVYLDRDGDHFRALWIVDTYPNQDGQGRVRLRSTSRGYLHPLIHDKSLFGLTGRRVSVQAQPATIENADWVPMREGNKVQLMGASGRYLRANGGVPPWRNSVTVSYEPRLRFMHRLLLWQVEPLVPYQSPAALPQPSDNASTAPTSPTSAIGSDEPGGQNFGLTKRIDLYIRS